MYVGLTRRYFAVLAYNSVVTQIPTLAPGPPTHSQTQTRDYQNRPDGRGDRGSFRGGGRGGSRGPFRKGFRKTSNSSNSGRALAGVAKKRTASRKTGSSSFIGAQSKPKGFPPSVGGGGIGMMPT